jgi:hypothetical protein
MRIGRTSAAIGLSASVFTSALICAPLGAAASDFSNYLAQGYSQLAKVAGKAPVSQLYKKRSTAAAGGQAIEPLQPDAKRLDVLTVNEARHYRDQLIEGLQAGGRQRQPLLAAIAQVNYDCWVMPLPKRKGAPRSAECHQRFLQAFEGLPDKNHRGPISSVEPWQLASAAPARGGDAIGALILSLFPADPQRQNTGYDSALASTYAVGAQPDGQMGGPMGGQVMGSCDANCLAMSFAGPGTAPLIAALIDNRDRNFRGAGDSNVGQQSANAAGNGGAPGTGNNGSSNNGQNGNGQSNNGQGANNSGGSVGSGSGSGSPGSGSPGSGSPGSGGPGAGPGSGDGGDPGDGGPGDGGPGNSGGHGHGHHHG